ncbi:HD-GYP domain-containing protein [Chungangia koreensis]|uniref:HD-GYP domain-containing protein n=1 Tax=Chungangia koreensis TaxID=752657 RepID=A0ABV8X6W6_9LACT
MDVTYMTFSELRIGQVLAEDVKANTRFPIIKKNTPLTNEHFQVLKAFNILKVPILRNNPFMREEVEEEQKDQSAKDFVESATMGSRNFLTNYKEAVDAYKKEFIGWQAGKKVDAAKLRSLILPLVDHALEEREILPLLNEYSEPKDYLYHHSVAVGIISGAIADKMKFTKGQVLQMATAGLMADSGMSKIDVKIREKTAFLTDSEFNEIRKHTIYSYQMVKDIPILKQEMKMAIFQHHERLDGSGYPKGEKLEQISILSQIIAVADVFHAMTSERIYRSKESPYKVIEKIKEEEFGKFNIQVVSALIDLLTNIPMGTTVRLSNGEIGEVVFTKREEKTRPIVKLAKNNEMLDLSAKRQLWIERVIGKVQ